MSALGVGCVKTPTLAARVETSRRNCVPESQIILHTRGVMPSWRIVFSTVRDCMSFYTARVIFVGSARSRRSRDVRFTPESGHRATQWACPLSAISRLRASQQERARCKTAPSYDLLATASLCERGPDGRCKKFDQGRDVRNRFNIEDGLLNRRLAI